MKREHITGYLRHLFFILAAAGAGASSVAPLIDWDKAELSPAFLIPVVYAFIRAAWLEYTTVKDKSSDTPT